ncbi:MAG: hypothetical protein IPH28_22315 [Cytophagaceae bacterium]|nr:hypothetical protein [Cytophagaceae bacterium]
MSKQYLFGLIILAAVALSSCYKEPDFSISPVIEFYTINSEVRLDQATGGVKDSVVVTIKFQDGDGDLGVNTEETTEYQKKYGYNFNVKMMREKMANLRKWSMKYLFQDFFRF